MRTTLINEDDLLMQISQHDESAFRQLFNEYWDNIYSVAFAFTKSKEVSEEIVQDVFVKIWSNREHLPEVKNFAGYIFTVARNHIYNTLRKKLKEISFPDQLELYFKETAMQPDEKLLFKESEQLINSAIQQLPQQQRLVFTMSRTEGFSQEEIAVKLNISKLTVKAHMGKALQSMREFLKTHSNNTLFLISIVQAFLFVNND